MRTWVLAIVRNNMAHLVAAFEDPQTAMKFCVDENYVACITDFTEMERPRRVHPVDWLSEFNSIKRDEKGELVQDIRLSQREIHGYDQLRTPSSSA